jgi:metallopeptidase MepB
VRSESGGIWFSREELDGLPKDAFSRLREGEVGNETEGKFWVSFKAADLDFISTYASDPETRRRAFIGNENKCKMNSALFRELIELRTEAAKLLGYASHVDLKSQNRMMTSESIETFLETLQDEIKPAGKSEKDRMRHIKWADLEARGLSPESIDDRIYLWDQNFYSRLVKENGGDFDTAKLSELFPLETTLQGLLGIFETMFGLVFNPVSHESRRLLMEKAGQRSEAITWHEDVKLFAVYDEEAAGGGFLGYLYLDLLKREGKADHPCNICFQPVG